MLPQQTFVASGNVCPPRPVCMGNERPVGRRNRTGLSRHWQENEKGEGEAKPDSRCAGKAQLSIAYIDRKYREGRATVYGALSIRNCLCSSEPTITIAAKRAYWQRHSASKYGGRECCRVHQGRTREGKGSE